MVPYAGVVAQVDLPKFHGFLLLLANILYKFCGVDTSVEIYRYIVHWNEDAGKTAKAIFTVHFSFIIWGKLGSSSSMMQEIVDNDKSFISRVQYTFFM